MTSQWQARKVFNDRHDLEGVVHSYKFDPHGEEFSYTYQTQSLCSAKYEVAERYSSDLIHGKEKSFLASKKPRTPDGVPSSPVSSHPTVHDHHDDLPPNTPSVSLPAESPSIYDLKEDNIATNSTFFRPRTPEGEPPDYESDNSSISPTLDEDDLRPLSTSYFSLRQSNAKEEWLQFVATRSLTSARRTSLDELYRHTGSQLIDDHRRYEEYCKRGSERVTSSPDLKCFPFSSSYGKELSVWKATGPLVDCAKRKSSVEVEELKVDCESPTVQKHKPPMPLSPPPLPPMPSSPPPLPPIPSSPPPMPSSPPPLPPPPPPQPIPPLLPNAPQGQFTYTYSYTFQPHDSQFIPQTYTGNVIYNYPPYSESSINLNGVYFDSSNRPPWHGSTTSHGNFAYVQPPTFWLANSNSLLGNFPPISANFPPIQQPLRTPQPTHTNNQSQKSNNSPIPMNLDDEDDDVMKEPSSIGEDSLYSKINSDNHFHNDQSSNCDLKQVPLLNVVKRDQRVSKGVSEVVSEDAEPDIAHVKQERIDTYHDMEDATDFQSEHFCYDQMLTTNRSAEAATMVRTTRRQAPERFLFETVSSGRILEVTANSGVLLSNSSQPTKVMFKKTSYFPNERYKMDTARNLLKFLKEGDLVHFQGARLLKLPLREDVIYQTYLVYSGRKYPSLMRRLGDSVSRYLTLKDFSVTSPKKAVVKSILLPFHVILYISFVKYLVAARIQRFYLYRTDKCAVEGWADEHFAQDDTVYFELNKPDADGNSYIRRFWKFDKDRS